MTAPSQAQQPQPEWLIAPELIPFDAAMGAMEQRVDDIAMGRAEELIWLLQHPPLYTAGTGAAPDELLDDRFPVYQVGRGGKHTYHGPGQRVVYAMLKLGNRGRDVRRYVWLLEEWIIRALARLGVTAERRDDNDDRRVGLWVARNDGSGLDDKIAAIGIRVRKWVAFHGMAINVTPDLSHYGGIVPCGITGHGITSLALLKPGVTMDQLDIALKETFTEVFA